MARVGRSSVNLKAELWIVNNLADSFCPRDHGKGLGDHAKFRFSPFLRIYCRFIAQGSDKVVKSPHGASGIIPVAPSSAFFPPLRIHPVKRFFWVLLVSCFCGVVPAAFADDLFFESKIRPVLVEKCQKCHNSQKQQGGLRLDSRSALLKGGDSGPSVVPGKIREGHLLAALRQDGELKMPPSGKLSSETIKDFETWIGQGANWPAEKQAKIGGRTQVIMDGDRVHWAFQPIKKTTPPPVGDRAHPKTEIDRFLQVQLEKANLTPVEQADKTTLIRRATFDLTGIPPTPEEIRAFEADTSPGDFAKVVERLLASPKYGERWGRHWLDVARYADTAGDGADYPLPEAWKYRNWVIQAFNADMPYDRFVREQIAGDILANRDKSKIDAREYADRVIATGFLAVGKRYGYAPNPDYQHLDFADAIESVGRSLMGLSLGCARCHDHKYEPVGMEDYYALYGIFQSSSWSFPGGEEHKKPDRLVPLVSPKEVKRLEGAKAEKVATLKARLREIQVEKGELSGVPFVGGPDLGFESQKVGTAPGGAWLSMGPNTITPKAQSPFAHIHPQGKQGVRMGAGGANEGIRYVFVEPVTARAGKKLHFSIDLSIPEKSEAKGAARLYVGRGVIASTAFDISISKDSLQIKNGPNWEPFASIIPGVWYSLQIQIDPDSRTYDGTLTPFDPTSGVKPVSFKKKALVPDWDGWIDTFICDGLGHLPGPVPLHDLDNIALSESPFAVPGSKVIAPPTPSAPKSGQQLAQLEASLKETRAQLDQAIAKPVYELAYGVSEGTPVSAKIQKRGEPEKPGPEVPRRFLEILGGDKLAPDSKGSGRLELAHWITRKENPLFARVMVNRIWQGHFGRGIVPTPSDFGLRGELPTHPELLDWLAGAFIDSGYSIKAMHRLILSTAAYQRSSRDEPGNAAIDPENHLLWKFSRRALDAESVRDMMLVLSGNLDAKQPEGHPFPPQSGWGFTIHAPFHAVYESNHRSVYLMNQRNRRHPYLALFDAADPNVSTAERLPTTTPTQALYLMNSPFVHEQAKGLAKRLCISGTDEERIEMGHMLTRGLAATPGEISESLEFLKTYRARLQANNTPPDQVGPLAWAALCRVWLTSNSALHVD